jgi:hypothetical protein
MNLNSTRHLNHEQLCDLLIDAPPDETSALLEANQEHLRDCLICASELELMRSSLAGFQHVSTTIADRELARKPIRPHFASIYNTPPRGLITMGFFWATAALVIAATIPLGMLNPRFNPMGTPETTVSDQATTTSKVQPISDAALLDGIDQDLSAALPAPMKPLAGPASNIEPASTDTQNQD